MTKQTRRKLQLTTRSHPTSGQKSRRRPKRMLVPSSEHEWRQLTLGSNREGDDCDGRTLQNAYEWDWQDFFHETTDQLRLPRPLPSSAVLAALPAHLSSTSGGAVAAARGGPLSASKTAPSSRQQPQQRGFNMPLLQHLRPLMKHYVDETNGTSMMSAANQSNVVSETTATTVVDAIDDSTLSTLTKGQHARYLTLESGSESWNEGRRKEFRKLSQRVQQEQEQYRHSLDKFWEQHLARFKVGLSSDVARYCMAYAKQYQASYCGPRHFGPCTQVISVQHVSKVVFTSARMNNTSLSLDSFDSKVVHEDDPTTKHIVDEDWQQRAFVPSVLDETKLPKLTMLQSDASRALQLAKQHGASIVTTEETLKALLQVSGEETSHWMIPVTRRQESGVLFLDVPIPTPTTPRECVSRGVTEGLYQSLMPSSSSSSTTRTSTATATHTVYTLLTLPSFSKSTRSTTKSTVLVRSERRVFQGHQGQNPLCIHTQLEYFPSRGWEESSSYERSLWILDKLLCQSSKTMVARVDPSTIAKQQASDKDGGSGSGVLQWMQVGVAHALVLPKNPLYAQMDPMNHVEAMVQVLCHAADTLAHGEQLLCLAPGATSISVHKACRPYNDNAETAEEIVVNLDSELEKADAVFTGAAALRQCARVWQWKVEDDRIPFTFPIKQQK